MNRIFLSLIVVLTLALNACNMTSLAGSGKITSTDRPVNEVTKLVFDAPGELALTQGDKEVLSIQADDNLLGYIKTKVTNGELHIYLAAGAPHLMPSKPIQYSLSVKSLEQVSLNGSGSIEAADFKGDQFDLYLNGSGSVRFDTLAVKMFDFGMNGSGSLNFDRLTAQTVSFNVVGSGDVTVNDLTADVLDASVNGSGSYLLKGKVAHQQLHSLGSGNYDARSLQSERAEVSIAGSGGSQVWVTETISISILGSGDVGYIGTPQITQTVAGSGSIYPLD